MCQASQIWIYLGKVKGAGGNTQWILKLLFHLAYVNTSKYTPTPRQVTYPYLVSTEPGCICLSFTGHCKSLVCRWACIILQIIQKLKVRENDQFRTVVQSTTKFGMPDCVLRFSLLLFSIFRNQPVLHYFTTKSFICFVIELSQLMQHDASVSNSYTFLFLLGHWFFSWDRPP